MRAGQDHAGTSAATLEVRGLIHVLMSCVQEQVEKLFEADQVATSKEDLFDLCS